MSVETAQRFSPSHPCPICGGHDGLPRGKGVRCAGFVSVDGEWARCSREEHAGAAPFDERSAAFVHRLKGDCKCGVHHGLADAAGDRNGHKARSRKGQKGRIVETYDYTDEAGNFLYQTVRFEPKDFRQRRPDGNGGWIWKIEGVRLVPYRLPELLSADAEKTVFYFEGEADADLARKLGLLGTTNPMGAGKWRPEYSEHLRGRKVVVVPDNDEKGRKHAQDVARSVRDVAVSVKVLELPGVPEGGGDFRDWVRNGGTVEELERLVDAQQEEGPSAGLLAGRSLLGRRIRDGIDPPAALVADVLLEGRSHTIYSGPGLGKTFLMLWLILRVLERGFSVILFDTENAERIVAERLEQMGAGPDMLDKGLYYLPYPSLPTTAEGRRAFEDALDQAGPALICYDSWINFLAGNGLDENSANDIAAFATSYIHPARGRGVATLLLDHVPHEGKHARGSTRKKDELDVVWSLRSLSPFDREKVGQIVLHREKDREGWLPLDVTFSLGGTAHGGFVFSRSAGTFEAEGDDGLKESERLTLRALETFGGSGAKASEWHKAAEKLAVKERSFWNAVRSLKQKGRVLQENKLYFAATANNCNDTAMHQNAPDPITTAFTAPPFRGAANCSTGAADDVGDDRPHPLSCECDECLYGEV